MSLALSFYSLVKDGKLDCREQIVTALKSFEGKYICLTIKEKKRGRSNPQNRFYHGYVVPVVMELLREYGNNADADTTHEFLKQAFLPPEGRNRVRVGKIIVESLSTAKLSASAFEDYLQSIRVFAAEHGYEVPLFNEHRYGII